MAAYRIVLTVTENPYRRILVLEEENGFEGWGIFPLGHHLPNTPAELREAQLHKVYMAFASSEDMNLRYKGLSLRGLRRGFYLAARQSNTVSGARFYMYIMKHIGTIVARGIKDGTLERVPKE